METPARSEPASGSDSAIAPIHSPRALRASSSCAPVGVGHRRPQALGAGQDAGRRHPGAGQLLADHAVLEDAEPEAALLGGHGDAEVAELGQPGQQGRRDLALLRVELVGDRQHLVHREPAGLQLQLLALGRVPRGQQHRAARAARSRLSSLDVIVGRLLRGRRMIHVHLGGCTVPPHAAVIRAGEPASPGMIDRRERSGHRRPRLTAAAPAWTGSGRDLTGNPDVVVTRRRAAGQRLARAAADHARAPPQRRRVGHRAAGDLRPRQRRDAAALRRRAADGAAHPPVPLSRSTSTATRTGCCSRPRPGCSTTTPPRTPSAARWRRSSASPSARCSTSSTSS